MRSRSGGMVRKFLEIQMTYNSLGVYFVGSYLPRRCGIATFTYDLAHAVGNEIGRENYRSQRSTTAQKGTITPKRSRLKSIRIVLTITGWLPTTSIIRESMWCAFSTNSAFSAVPRGRTSTTSWDLKKPVLTTFHTVMREPSEEYRRALQGVAELSQGVVVMSRQAVEILNTVYGIPEHKIHFIHHGVPDVPFVDPNYYKDQFQVEGRFVILTFGLLSPNKGLETVIKGLPRSSRDFRISLTSSWARPIPRSRRSTVRNTGFHSRDG